MMAEDKSSVSANSVESNEGERRLLSSNKANTRSPSLDVNNYIFSEETVAALQELGEVLKRIRKRLISEGVNIDDERKKLRAE